MKRLRILFFSALFLLTGCIPKVNFVGFEELLIGNNDDYCVTLSKYIDADRYFVKIIPLKLESEEKDVVVEFGTSKIEINMDSDFSGEINSYYAEVVVLYYDNTSYAIILESIKADQEKISDCFPKGSIINIKFLFEYGEIFIYAESIGKQVLFDSDSNYIAEIGSI